MSSDNLMRNCNPKTKNKKVAYHTYRENSGKREQGQGSIEVLLVNYSSPVNSFFLN